MTYGREYCNVVYILIVYLFHIMLCACIPSVFFSNYVGFVFIVLCSFVQVVRVKKGSMKICTFWGICVNASVCVRTTCMITYIFVQAVWLMFMHIVNISAVN